MDEGESEPLLEHFFRHYRLATSKINFTITLSDSNDPNGKKFLPDCLYHEVTVPDFISRVSKHSCIVCNDANGHTICPSCLGYPARKFVAFMGRGVDLACPLCFGLDFMRKDKEFLEAHRSKGLPEQERLARSRRIECRLKELEY